MARFFVVGEINADLVLEGVAPFPELGREVLAEGSRLALGSSSAITAAGLARLGEEVHFAGEAGEDLLGRFCRDEMQRLGIGVDAVRLRRDRTTGVTVSLSSDGERALVTHPGATARFTLREAPSGYDHLHVGSPFLQKALRPELAALFRDARQKGLTTSLDPGHDPEGHWELDDVLPETDVLLPNAEELRQLSGREDPLEALRALGAGATVVKLGAEGAAGLDGGRLVSVPAPPVAMRDATGAGDSFDAGFLFAWTRRMPLRECLRHGVAAGSLATRGPGGTSAQPSLEELVDFMGRSAP